MPYPIVSLTPTSHDNHLPVYKHFHFVLKDRKTFKKFCFCLQALRTPFYRGSDICLLAYAIDDLASFKGLAQWREEFIKYADISSSQFPFIVVGNKVRLLSGKAFLNYYDDRLVMSSPL